MKEQRDKTTTWMEFEMEMAPPLLLPRLDVKLRKREIFTKESVRKLEKRHNNMEGNQQ
jgi:hypothetical protein